MNSNHSGNLTPNTPRRTHLQAKCTKEREKEKEQKSIRTQQETKQNDIRMRHESGDTKRQYSSGGCGRNVIHENMNIQEPYSSFHGDHNINVYGQLEGNLNANIIDNANDGKGTPPSIDSSPLQTYDRILCRTNS